MIKLINLLVLIFLSNAMFGQTSFSLTEALNYAVSNNTEIKNSQLNLLVAEEKIKESISSGLPKIYGTLGFQNFIDIPTTVLPANTFNPSAPEGELIGLQFGTSINASGTIRMDQLIFSATYISGLKAAKSYKNLMGILVEKTKLELLEMTTNAYYSVLIFKNSHAILKQSLEKLESIQQETKSLVIEGLIEEINIDQINLLVLQLKNQLSELEIQELNTQGVLKLIMGYPQDSVLLLSDELNQFFLQDWKLNDVIANPQESIDYKILQESVRLNALYVKMNKATWLPSLSGYFSHQQIALRNEFNLFSNNYPWYPSTFWGIKVNVPIFDSREQSAKTNQAKLELEKTKNSILNKENSIKQEIHQAVAEYNINRLNLKNIQENLLLAEKILKNTLIKYKEGFTSGLEVTQAQNQALIAQNQLLQSNFKMLLSKVKLDKLLNKLSL